MKRTKLFLFNTLILTISALIIRVISVSFNIYISNRVGKEALGVFHLIMSVYLFGITLATSGINLATTRIVSEELERGNEDGIRKVTKKCIRISLLCGTAGSLILLCCSDFILHTCLHDKVGPSVLYLICLALPFIAMAAAINGYFTAVRRVYKTASGQFIEQLVKITATAYILNLFFPIGLEYACFSLILGDVISEIASFAYIYLLYQIDKRKHLKKITPTQEKYTKRILTISIPVALTSYIRSGLSTLKQLIIPNSLEKSGISYEEALSRYGLVNGMAMPLILFPSIFINSFSGLLVPEFSRYHVKKDYKRIKEVTIYFLSLTAIFSIILSIFFSLYADKLGILFYDDIQVGTYIKILAPILILIHLDTVIDSILKGLNAQVSIMFINILDLTVTVLFIYFFVPQLGITGYILSIFISETLNLVISGWRLITIIQKRNLIKIKQNIHFLSNPFNQKAPLLFGLEDGVSYPTKKQSLL